SLLFSSLSTATPYIYTLSLHDALPILHRPHQVDVAEHFEIPRLAPARLVDGEDIACRNGAGIVDENVAVPELVGERLRRAAAGKDRKSTRLNSSHLGISYAVFCLKKKK